MQAAFRFNDYFMSFFRKQGKFSKTGLDLKLFSSASSAPDKDNNSYEDPFFLEKAPFEILELNLGRCKTQIISGKRILLRGRRAHKKKKGRND